MRASRRRDPRSAARPRTCPPQPRRRPARAPRREPRPPSSGCAWPDAAAVMAARAAAANDGAIAASANPPAANDAFAASSARARDVPLAARLGDSARRRLERLLVNRSRSASSGGRCVPRSDCGCDQRRRERERKRERETAEARHDSRRARRARSARRTRAPRRARRRRARRARSSARTFRRTRAQSPLGDAPGAIRSKPAAKPISAGRYAPVRK